MMSGPTSLPLPVAQGQVAHLDCAHEVHHRAALVANELAFGEVGHGLLEQRESVRILGDIHRVHRSGTGHKGVSVVARGAQGQRDLEWGGFGSAVAEAAPPGAALSASERPSAEDSMAWREAHAGCTRLETIQSASRNLPGRRCQRHREARARRAGPAVASRGSSKSPARRLEATQSRQRPGSGEWIGRNLVGVSHVVASPSGL